MKKLILLLLFIAVFVLCFAGKKQSLENIEKKIDIYYKKVIYFKKNNKMKEADKWWKKVLALKKEYGRIAGKNKNYKDKYKKKHIPKALLKVSKQLGEIKKKLIKNNSEVRKLDKEYHEIWGKIKKILRNSAEYQVMKKNGKLSKRNFEKVYYRILSKNPEHKRLLLAQKINYKKINQILMKDKEYKEAYIVYRREMIKYASQKDKLKKKQK